MIEKKSNTLIIRKKKKKKKKKKNKKKKKKKKKKKRDLKNPSLSCSTFAWSLHVPNINDPEVYIVSA